MLADLYPPLPFDQVARFDFWAYRIFYGKAVIQAGKFSLREAALVSKQGAYAPLQVRIKDGTDLSRPVAGCFRSPDCILCVMGTSHSMALHTDLLTGKREPTCHND